MLEPELRTKKGAHDFAQHLLTKAAERLRNANKGFGFIAPDQGGKRRSSVPASSGLAEGRRVAIDIAQGQKGPEAVGLRLI